MTKPGPKRGPIKGRGAPILAVVGNHLAEGARRVRAYPEGIEICPWCQTGIARELRVCPGCKVSFQPIRGTKQYCGDQCRQRARSDRLIGMLSPVLRHYSEPDLPAAESQAASGAPATPAGPSVADQIRQLAELRVSGILSEAEFQAKKTELLARI
jgi:hypothetical protein